MSGAFGGLESPALCQPGAAVVVVLVGGRPAARPVATLGPRIEPREPRGFAGSDPDSRKGSNRIFEPGSTPARFEPPDHERSCCSYVLVVREPDEARRVAAHPARPGAVAPAARRGARGPEDQEPDAALGTERSGGGQRSRAVEDQLVHL